MKLGKSEHRKLKNALKEAAARPTVVVYGPSGNGKTSLINAIFNRISIQMMLVLVRMNPTATSLVMARRT